MRYIAYFACIFMSYSAYSAIQKPGEIVFRQDFSNGINLKQPAFALPKGFFPDGVNVYAEGSGIRKRPGLSKHTNSAFADSVKSIYNYRDSDNRDRLIVASGERLWVDDTLGGTFAQEATGFTDGFSFSGVNYRGRAILATSDGKLKAFNGSEVDDLGIATLGAATLTASSGGSLTDTKWYKVRISCYVSDTGFENTAGTASTAKQASSPNLQFALTSVPICDHSGTSERRFYISDAMANSTDTVASWTLSNTLYDNATTSIVISDNGDGVTVAQENNTAPTTGGGAIGDIYRQRYFYAKNTTMYYSNAIDIDGFPTSNFIRIGSGGPITGIKSVPFMGDSDLFGVLLVFKESSIHAYKPLSDAGTTFVLERISDSVGSVNQAVIREQNGVAYFLSRDGWYAYDGRKLHKISEVIDPIFRDQNEPYSIRQSQIDSSFSVYYPTLNQYMTWSDQGTDDNADRAWIFQLGAWFKYKLPAVAAGEGYDYSGDPVVFIAKTDKHIYTHSLKEDWDDDNSGIESWVRLNWFTPGAGITSSYFADVFTLLRGQVAGNLTVEASFNFDTTVSKTLTLDMTPSGSGFILGTSALGTGALEGVDLYKPIKGELRVQGTAVQLKAGNSVTGQGFHIDQIAIESRNAGNLNY